VTTVLIAPDKFKGSLSAAEVADTLAGGLTRAGMDVLTLPLADGGDGSVAAALAAGFTAHLVTVAGATGNPHNATIATDGDTAVVEVANTCGLATLAGGRLAPMTASSYGFGQAIRHAIDLGARRIVLALGGSASSDAGIGMLAALGWRFRGRAGGEIAAIADNLTAIHTVDAHAAAVDLSAIEFIVAGDVTNPLLGADGAAAVYGPQKGADIADIDRLANGHDNLVGALQRSGRSDARRLAAAPGAGAAGGCGYAAALLGARIVSGADFFLDLLDFETQCAQADFVITGEGRLDTQTLSGKLPAAVAERAAAKPVIAVVGIDLLGSHTSPFAAVFAASDHSAVDTARDPIATRAALQAIAARIAGSPPSRRKSSHFAGK